MKYTNIILHCSICLALSALNTLSRTLLSLAQEDDGEALRCVQKPISAERMKSGGYPASSAMKTTPTYLSLAS